MSWNGREDHETSLGMGMGMGMEAATSKVERATRITSSLESVATGGMAGVGGTGGVGGGGVDPEYAVSALVAKYGGEILSGLRRQAELLEFVAACGKLRREAWAAMADEWSRVVSQVVAQIEDTDLTGSQPIEQKQLTTEETLKRCIREHTTILLHTQTKDGGKRDVEVEPYRLATDQRHQDVTLTCWNIDHAHIERLPLHRILYSKGIGIHFIPRYDSYIEGEDEEEQEQEQGC